MTTNPLNDKWRDIEQVITLACPVDAAEIVDRIRQLVTTERMAVRVDAQVAAIRWVARELGRDTTIGGVVARLGELVERGDVKP